VNPDINMDDANLDVNNDINNNKDNTDNDISNDNANNDYEPIPDVDLMGDSHMMMGGDDLTNVNGEYQGNDDNEVFMPDNVNNDDNNNDIMQNSIDLIDNVGNYNNMGMDGNNDEVLGFDNNNDDIVIKENKNKNLKDFDDLGEIEISKYI